MTLEEFKANREQEPALFPQPVSDALTADDVRGDAAAGTPVAEESAIDQPPQNGAADSPPTGIERGEPIQPAEEPATNPQISEPAQLEPGGGSVGLGLF
jgi:hypothetical protein